MARNHSRNLLVSSSRPWQSGRTGETLMDTTLNLLTAHAAGRKALREELPYAADRKVLRARRL